MKQIAAALTMALALGSVASAETIPPEKVKEKAQTCAACHGADGKAAGDGQSQYPRLAGQYHDYIARALHEYKNGDRKNAIMAGFATPLSDAEIDALARYFGSMTSNLDDLAKHEQGSD